MDPLPEHLRSLIRTKLRDRQVHGLAVCAFDRDRICFAGGVGQADLERAESVTPATIFRVASVSKLLTATLLLRLVDSNDLDLDAPLNRYLPPDLRIVDRAGHPAPCRLRTLLSHTSGLPPGVRGADPGNPVLSYLSNQGRVRTLTDAISGLRLTRAPGEQIVYSNPAFNVVGYVAASAFGLPFETAMQEHVLGPLGMADSDFRPRPSGPGVATPYGSMTPPRVSSKPADRMRLVATPMGGLSTNVMDLARFGQMILNRGTIDGRRILSPHITVAATSMEATNHPDLDQGYGLGFKVRTWRGRTIVGHDGNMPGVSAQLLVSSHDGVGAVVLTNGYALGVPHEIALLTLEHLLGMSADLAPESRRPLPRRQPPEWDTLGARAAGAYRLLDASPPGPIGKLSDLMTHVRVTHETGGRLRIDGNPGSDGPTWLLPDGDLGRYRIAGRVDDGTSAAIEERTDGFHLWLAHTTHLLRRR